MFHSLNFAAWQEKAEQRRREEEEEEEAAEAAAATAAALEREREQWEAAEQAALSVSTLIKPVPRLVITTRDSAYFFAPEYPIIRVF